MKMAVNKACCYCGLLSASVSASVCLCVYQAMTDSSSMKRSFSTIGDQCVNGLWLDEYSLERVSPDMLYRPRRRSYKGTGQSPLPL